MLERLTNALLDACCDLDDKTLLRLCDANSADGHDARCDIVRTLLPLIAAEMAEVARGRSRELRELADTATIGAARLYRALADESDKCALAIEAHAEKMGGREPTPPKAG